MDGKVVAVKENGVGCNGRRKWVAVTVGANFGENGGELLLLLLVLLLVTQVGGEAQRMAGK